VGGLRYRGLGLGLWLGQPAAVIVLSSVPFWLRLRPPLLLHPGICQGNIAHYHLAQAPQAPAMSPPNDEDIFKGMSPHILRVPETWKETLCLSPGREASMGEVLDSITGLCKSKYASQDGADSETLAAEAEEVMKQVRAQLGPIGSAEEVPGPDESATKAQEMLEKLKAGTNGFPRKSTQGKNNICFVQGAGIESNWGTGLDICE
jgi:hypothetical protein